MASFRFLIGIVSFFHIIVFAEPVTYQMTDLSLRNLLQVTSEAMLEKVSVQIPVFQGQLSWDRDKEFKLEGLVDVRSLRSGSALRDQILLYQILEVNKHPQIKVVLTSPLNPQLAPAAEGPLTLKAQAQIEYRGQTQNLEFPLKIQFYKESESTRQRLPGNLIKLSGTFDATLSSWGIPIPPQLSAVLSDQIQVVLDAVASEQIPNSKILLPEGPKPKERS